MEKEIVWTSIAQQDFWNILFYLEGNWSSDVLDKFNLTLEIKIKLLQKQPNIGFKSVKHSRFRQTLITRHYKLLYSVKEKSYCYFEAKAYKHEITILHCLPTKYYMQKIG